MNAKEKQNNSLVNALITIAESSSKTGVIPASKSKKETVKEVVFRVLKENPYKFRQNELFDEVHINQMGKDESLKLERYQLQRSELCSLLGWGIHGNEEGKLALIPAESADYEALLKDPIVKKKNAYKK